MRTNNKRFEKKHFLLADSNIHTQKSIVIRKRVDCICFLEEFASLPFKETALWHIWLINLCQIVPSDDSCLWVLWIVLLALLRCLKQSPKGPKPQNSPFRHLLV